MALALVLCDLNQFFFFFSHRDAPNLIVFFSGFLLTSGRDIFADRAVTIGLARGLHRRKPPSETGLTAVAGRAPPTSRIKLDLDDNACCYLVEVIDYWQYWKRAWQALVFLNGWVPFLACLLAKHDESQDQRCCMPKKPPAKSWQVFKISCFSEVRARSLPKFMDSLLLPAPEGRFSLFFAAFLCYLARSFRRRARVRVFFWSFLYFLKGY